MFLSLGKNINIIDSQSRKSKHNIWALPRQFQYRYKRNWRQQKCGSFGDARKVMITVSFPILWL